MPYFHRMVKASGAAHLARRLALDVDAPATSNGYTFAAKIKLPALPPTDAYYRFLDIGDNSASAQRCSVLVDKDGKLWASMYTTPAGSSGAYDISTDAAVWTAGATKTIHVVCDLSQAVAADKMKLYVDGAFPAQTVFPAVVGSGPINWQNSPVSRRHALGVSLTSVLSNPMTVDAATRLVGEVGFYFFDFEPYTDTTRFYNGGDVAPATMLGTAAVLVSGLAFTWNAGTNQGDAGDYLVTGAYTDSYGFAVLPSTATMDVTGTVSKLSDATLTGTGTLEVSGTVISQVNRATLTGTGSLTVDGYGTRFGLANLSGTGTETIIGTTPATGYLLAPPERRLLIAAETRASLIPSESRQVAVPAEPRSVSAA